MIKIQSVFLFLLMASSIFGQGVFVETYAFTRREEKASVITETLKFPVIKTGSTEIDKLINGDLLDRFTGKEFSGLSTEQTLFEWSEGIEHMSFEITYLKNNLISFNIFFEGCGAYCTTRTDYFTYNITTGQHISIDQIIEVDTKFKAQVIAERNHHYEKQKEQIIKRYKSKEPYLEEDIFKMAINCINTCTASFNPQSFSLREDRLEIIDDCSFPHVIRSLQPYVQLQYKYENIKEVLKMKL